MVPVEQADWPVDALFTAVNTIGMGDLGDKACGLRVKIHPFGIRHRPEGYRNERIYRAHISASSRKAPCEIRRVARRPASGGASSGVGRRPSTGRSAALRSSRTLPRQLEEEERDIRLALCKARHTECCDIQPIEEIRSKTTGCNLRLEIDFARRNEAFIEGICSFEASRVMTRSCRTRRNFACKSKGIEPISSNRIVRRGRVRTCRSTGEAHRGRRRAHGRTAHFR